VAERKTEKEVGRCVGDWYEEGGGKWRICGRLLSGSVGPGAVFCTAYGCYSYTKIVHYSYEMTIWYFETIFVYEKFSYTFIRSYIRTFFVWHAKMVFWTSVVRKIIRIVVFCNCFRTTERFVCVSNIRMLATDGGTPCESRLSYIVYTNAIKMSSKFSRSISVLIVIIIFYYNYCKWIIYYH
jgi:hypothetical protein